VAAAACTSTPLRQMPPGLPLASPTVPRDATNAGRVQSIAVSPTDANRSIIAMQFGGLWRTFNNGATWFRVYTLPTVFVTDVEFGSDGKTVVATVFRDNGTMNGGGIYVSRDGGDFWSRPATGAVPVIAKRTPSRTSAYAVSRAPDERGLWYVGTDYGVAVSRDDGVTWRHVRVDPGMPLADDRQQDAAQSVLAFPGGTVLAMTRAAVYRSDNRGASWKKVITDDFSQWAPGGGGGGYSGNKMDRSPFAPWAFIMKRYDDSGGSLWFYELDSGTMTMLPLPQGRSRGPFVRVVKDKDGDGTISVWVGTGWDGYYVTRNDAASIRAIRTSDWVSFIKNAGIHADMGDLGLDGDGHPVLVGSDGGIFKPDPAKPGRWMSAAVPGSSMNSLQISDLAGTNVTRDDRSVVTSLYFTTQDNRIWASPDGGATWPNGDAQEGFGLEVRSDARSGEKITVGYVAIGAHAQSERFSDANMVNQRSVPNADPDGNSIMGLGMAYFMSQRPGGSFPSHWVRLRPVPGVPMTEIYLSENSGSNWRKRIDLSFSTAGEVKPTVAGAFGWIPVFTGEVAPDDTKRIGLVFLYGLYADPLDPPGKIYVFDDSDMVRLPGGGSLGRRATEFDWHAVFGVHRLDWQFVIAADIVAGDMKITRDGGATWYTDVALTKQVLRDGALKMWDGDSYHMQVTEIAFDPLREGRILVGTRDAGIVCTADGGQTWRTIYDSDKIKYITGFHFHPGGAVYISSYGHGLWYLKAAPGCAKTYDLPWDVKKQGASPRAAGTRQPAPPRGVPDPNRPKLFVATGQASTGVAILGPDHVVRVTGRGFQPDANVELTIRDRDLLRTMVRADERGQLATTFRVPIEAPFGNYTIEARENNDVLTTADFVKGFSEEGKAARDAATR
jgi:hypothetical protein